MGQDPHIIQYENSFLLIQSAYANTRIVIKQFTNLNDMKRNQSHTVWIEGKHQLLWAPELHEIGGKWYIYYAASPTGRNEDHRMYVLEADTPLGHYHSLGRVETPDDFWAIDQTILHHEGQYYTFWSGWPTENAGFPQNLYGALLHSNSNGRIVPNRIGARSLLSKPSYEWEQSISSIIEGPQVLKHQEKLFLTFSANASWTNEYCVGLLEYIGGPILSSDSWVKHPQPILKGGGHGCQVGDFYVYHRKLSHAPGWNDRELGVTKVEWDDQGLPHLT